MRFLTFTALITMVSWQLMAQCDIINSLQVINVPNQVAVANMECTDAAGWTHYYNSISGKLLISIKKNGQNIGGLGTGLIVEASTIGGYGNGAHNLSSADYIDNDVWLVSNRYWQVKGANAISSTVQIRFYFHNEDVSDIASSVDDFGFFVDEPKDVLMFTISNGNGLNPLSTELQPVNGIFTLYDMVPGPAPDWTDGTLNGNPFAEFSVSTLDIGGAAGFLIFQQDPPVSISGQIKKANGNPISDVKVEAATSSVDFTDASGNYDCPTLITGAGYTVTPTKNTNHKEGISVIDLIFISRHLMGMELFNSPFKHIAANADNNSALTTNDLDQVRKVLLGELPAFPSNESWRFVPKNYTFLNPNNPLLEAFPGTIQIPFLSDTLTGQDFTGVKIGDVAEDGNANPPALNTGFVLPNATTCNPGDTVVFELKVQDFTGIRGFQFTLEWDEAVMDYYGVQNFNLGGLTAQSFGTSAAPVGKLTVVWFNPNNNGSSLSNNTSICKLKFIAAGNYGDESALSFTGTGLAPLVFHQNLSHDVPDFTTGHLLIENNSVLTASSVVEPAGCNGQAIGSVDLTVNGGVPPLSYHWSNGATTQDIANLPGGYYRVTVSDASGNCPKAFEFAVAPTGPIGLGAIVSDMSCPNIVDGAIDLGINNGAGPFTFLWSNGKTSEDIDNLFMGIYTVTVTDVAGCTNTGSFEVQNPNKIMPSVSITNATNAGSPDGAVTINSIMGSVAPFTFSWNTGATTQSIQNLPPGDYIVTINDGAGCSHVFGYLVNDLMVSVGPGPAIQPGAQFSPNPILAGNQGFLKLELDSAERVNLTVYNSIGEEWGRMNVLLEAGENIIPMQAPAVAGVYFIKIKRPKGAVAWVNIVVD